MESISVNVMPDGRVCLNDAAAYLGFAAKTLHNWIGRGIGPRSIKIGGRRFYRLTDLQAFVASQGAR